MMMGNIRQLLKINKIYCSKQFYVVLLIFYERLVHFKKSYTAKC